MLNRADRILIGGGSANDNCTRYGTMLIAQLLGLTDA